MVVQMTKGMFIPPVLSFAAILGSRFSGIPHSTLVMTVPKYF